MAVLPIVTYPKGAILLRQARPVPCINRRVRRLIRDMLDTLYDAGGAGLAAPQVGVGQRVIVVDITPDPCAEGAIVLVNPEIRAKVCSYACVYCQLGRTTRMRADRSSHSSPWEIRQAAQAALASAREAGEAVDYLSFVPDGEPTLDANLGRAVALLRPLGVPTAVISNASLVWQKDVREDLMRADWVSLKVDATQEADWRRVDRPHGALRLGTILDGLLAFAQSYRGTLVTETMLVAGLNDGEGQIEDLAGFLAHLKPAVAYLSVPTRPPAEPWVRAPGESTVLRAHCILSEQVERVECLTGYEGNAFASTGDVAEDLLSITAVHPMREDAVCEFLARAGAGWGVVHRLLAAGELVGLDYEGQRFYLRAFQRGGAGDG